MRESLRALLCGLPLVLATACSLGWGPVAQAGLVTDGLIVRYDGDHVSPTGSLVDTWTDLAGGDNNATATGTERPTLVSAGLNGHDVLRFSGAQYITAGADSVFDTDNLTWFIMVNLASDPDVQFLMGSAYTSGSTAHRNPELWSSYFENYGNPFFSSRALPADGSWSSSRNYASGDEWALVTCVWDGDADTSQEFLNGVAGNMLTTSDADPSGHIRMRVGAKSSATPRYYLFGDVAEVRVYNRTLSTAERQEVEAYLEAKYVPEPSTLMLLGSIAVLLLLGFLVRPRRRGK